MTDPVAQLSELDYIRLMLLVKDTIGSCEVLKIYIPGAYDETQHRYYEGLYNRLDKLMTNKYKKTK